MYLVGLSHLADAGGLYEVRQHKGGLLNTPLALQVLPLLAPMPGDRYTVTVCLQQPTAVTLQQPTVIALWKVYILCTCCSASASADNHHTVMRRLHQPTDLTML